MSERGEPRPSDPAREVLDSILDLVVIERAVRDDATGEIVDFEIEWMNATQIDAAGRPREELIGRRISELYPALAGGELIAGYRRVVETGEPLVVPVLPYEDEIDGRQVSGFYTVQATRVGDDGIVVASRDITAQEQDRRTLESALRELETAQRLARMGSWRIDLRTDELHLSPQLYRIYGVDPSEVAPTVEWFRQTVLHPDDLAEALARRSAAIADQVGFTLEHRIIRADGRVVWLYSTCEPIVEDGETVALWGTSQDITERIRDREALVQARAAVAAERSIAEHLQRALLPAGLPELDGWELQALYEPAGVESRIGGDWYDAFVTDPGTLVVVVGDVAGHGTASAALMAQARNAIRGIAHHGAGRDPAMILTALNRLGASAWPGEFITLLVATIDLRSGATTYARAGHPPALLINGPTTAYLDEVNGPFVGPFQNVTYRSASTSLRAGQRLLLYTDGLIERRGETVAHSLERLRQEALSLSTSALADMCIRLQARMLRLQPRHDDDLCILAVERIS
jgi:PAS domain S-box-containing protein